MAALFGGGETGRCVRARGKKISWISLGSQSAATELPVCTSAADKGTRLYSTDSTRRRSDRDLGGGKGRSVETLRRSGPGVAPSSVWR